VVRLCRTILAGVFLALLGELPGCALLHHRPAPKPDPLCNSGCDRPLECLVPLLGPCGDLNPVQPGRRITLWECIESALKNGRVGEDQIRVRALDAAMALAQAKVQGEAGRLQTERIWLTLEEATQELVLAVESAYWGLALARVNLGSREEALQALDEEAATVRARFQEKLLARQDVDTLEEQRNLARVELIDAQAKAREAERTLRRTAGLPPDDGSALVPGDPPDTSPPQCDAVADLDEARSFRTELALARLDVDVACKELAQVKDEKDRPQARMKVERQQAALRNAEDEMIFALQRSQRKVTQAWQSYLTLTAREEAARRRLEAVNEKWQSKEFGELRELLQARSGAAAARRDTQEALSQYQVARAELMRQKGTLLKFRCVRIVRKTPRVTPGG
jgi:hypothetical protein